MFTMVWIEAIEEEIFYAFSRFVVDENLKFLSPSSTSKKIMCLLGKEQHLKENVQVTS